jgi:DNA-binding MarR family transcriptional regulator
MSPPNKSPRYGPIPLRACRDLRLGAAHFRALTAIAGFDRLGKNGQGCWASQDRIAELVGCSKSHLSNILTHLRNCGYITSKINPDKRWSRIHRVIYTEEDFNCLGKGKSVHSPVNCLEPYSPLVDTTVDSPVNQQFTTPPKKDSESNALQNVTIEEDYIRRDQGRLRGQDCAQARSRRRQSMPLGEAENYLTECEALVASRNWDALQLECPVIQEIADDACLPEHVNDRAAKLLYNSGASSTRETTTG